MTAIIIHLSSGVAVQAELDEDVETVGELRARVNQTSGPRWIELGTALVFSHGLLAIELA